MTDNGMTDLSGNSTIALIICHIGKLPWYFEYFVHSCKYNPSIDFFVISDDAAYRPVLPKNVILIHKTLSEISALSEKQLGFAVNIKSGYKLCDFKPAYGFIFSELIQRYDFWGHGDIDVIFGNIRSFITEDILRDHDLICVRHDFLTGYFLLFRNVTLMNNLFKLSKDYKTVLQSENHYCFDETNFQFDAFAQGKQYHEISSEIESMMHVIQRMQQQGLIRAFFDFFVVEGIPGNLKWIRGTLFFRKHYEILLYHMIHFKKKYCPKSRPKHIPETFTISKNKIYHKYT